MTARRITAPVLLPVSLAAAITAARADGAGIDADIERDVRAFAGEVEHQTGRALIEQTWVVTLDRFDTAIRLAKSPLIAVDSVKFLDADGVLLTLDPQDYTVDNVSEPGEIVPAPGCAWPATANRINAVQVQYRCGHGLDAASVPPEIQSYILGRIAEKYAPPGTRANEFLVRLLDGFKVYSW